MAQSKESRRPQAPPPSLDDAIARVKAAVSASERARATGELPYRAGRRIFDLDLKVPRHPHARLVQRGAIAAAVAGALGLIFLPDSAFLHMLFFAGFFAIILIGVPNLVLKRDGSVAPVKLASWCALLLLAGALTTIATGENSDGLWDWAPFLHQFTSPGGPSTAQPHP
jgi:hypothetical protein